MSPTAADGTPRAAAWVPPLVILPLLLFQVHAFRWGVVMTDTLFQWEQAVSGAYDDWHPPATTWLWRQLMRLGPGTAPILLFDCLLYWTGVWLIADALRRRGSNRAMAGALLVGALPIPFGQMGAILKDPLLAACCLAALGLAAWSEDLAPRRRIAGAFACAILAFASATRFNAVFATAPLLVLWWPRAWLTAVPRALLALVVSALLLASANLLIDDVLLRPHRSHPIFSLVNFDLAGIVAHGGPGAYPELSTEEERSLVARCYDPSQFNPTYRPDCDALEDGLATYSAERGIGPVSLWLQAVRRAPLAYLRHRLAHLDRNLRFAVPRVPPDAVYFGKTAANPYGLSFQGGGEAKAVYRAAQWMAASPLGRPATWLAVALGLLVVAPCLRSRALVTAAALSSLGYGGAYALVSVAPDLRYNLWTMLAAMMGLAIAAAEAGRAGIAPRRLRAAALPALLAVTVELAAMALG